MNKNGIDKKQVWSDIASRIKELRKNQKQTLKDLSKKTGFTMSYISQIENLKREPTVGALLKIAYALTVNVSYFFDGIKSETEKKSIVIVRRNQRETILNPFGHTNTIYESLNSKMNGRLMNCYIVTPPFEFLDDSISHKGQELFFILEGSQELIIDGESYVLEEGDSCYFDASKPHRARSVGEKSSKVLIAFVE